MSECLDLCALPGPGFLPGTSPSGVFSSVTPVLAMPTLPPAHTALSCRLKNPATLTQPETPIWGGRLPCQLSPCPLPAPHPHISKSVGSASRWASHLQARLRHWPPASPFWKFPTGSCAALSAPPTPVHSPCGERSQPVGSCPELLPLLCLVYHSAVNCPGRHPATLF